MQTLLETQKIVEDIAEQAGQRPIDILQQLLEFEIQKKVAGSVKVRFLLDGGFEGEYRIEIESIQVRTDKDALTIVIDGVNGEMELEIRING